MQKICSDMQWFVEQDKHRSAYPVPWGMCCLPWCPLWNNSWSVVLQDYRYVQKRHLDMSKKMDLFTPKAKHFVSALTRWGEEETAQMALLSWGSSSPRDTVFSWEGRAVFWSSLTRGLRILEHLPVLLTTMLAVPPECQQSHLCMISS